MEFMRMKMEHRRRFFQIGLGSVGLLRLVVFCWSGLRTKRGRYAGEMGGGEGSWVDLKAGFLIGQWKGFLRETRVAPFSFCTSR